MTERGLALTGADNRLIELLAMRVKAVTPEQLAGSIWRPRKRRSCQRRCRQLAAAGWVTAHQVSVPLAQAPDAPLLTWSPGQPAPDFSDPLRVARGRWNRASTMTPIVTLGPLGAARFGARPRALRLSEVPHDLLLTDVFLDLQAGNPRAAAAWRGECAPGRRSRPNEVVPDAIIRSAGRCRAIEVVGSSYTTTRMAALHEHCVRSGMGYELW